VCRRLTFNKEQCNRRQYGYTLVELSLVVLILAIMAAAVIPAIMPADSGKLQVAAQEIADAMRFARSEAMRLRQPRGFRYNAPQTRIRMFRPDTGTLPWAPIYDIYHPVSKKPYDILLDEHYFGAVETSTQIHEFRGTCNLEKSIYFDANGTPFCTDPHTVPVLRYDISITLGDHTRLVSLEPITGQVTIK